MADAAANLPWLRVAIPRARFTILRLRASQATLRERLSRREIGSALDGHLFASERAASRIDDTDDGFLVIETDDRTVTEIAREAIALAGWLDVA